MEQDMDSQSGCCRLKPSSTLAFALNPFNSRQCSTIVPPHAGHNHKESESFKNNWISGTETIYDKLIMIISLPTCVHIQRHTQRWNKMLAKWVAGLGLAHDVHHPAITKHELLQVSLRERSQSYFPHRTHVWNVMTGLGCAVSIGYRSRTANLTSSLSTRGRSSDRML